MASPSPPYEFVWSLTHCQQNKALDSVKSKASSAAPSRASSVASTNSNAAPKAKSKGKKK